MTVGRGLKPRKTEELWERRVQRKIFGTGGESEAMKLYGEPDMLGAIN